MTYQLLDDAPTADIGFTATGATLAECFQAAADATLDVMLANRDALVARERRSIAVESDRLDLALLKFLEEVIFYKDAEGLFLRATRVNVEQQGERWIVRAELAGELIDPPRHQLSADVKAVTLHRLAVRQTNGAVEATVVLDI